MSTETPLSAPFRSLCTDCGISRSSDPKRCGRACQFIAPDYPGLEQQVHGRARDAGRVDELHFGPFRQMWSASLKTPLLGAQWTGITTRFGERLLESGKVDAVLAMSGDPDDRWKPVPVLVTRADDMKQCRGMRMGYAPLLSLLEPAAAQGIRRLAVIGIPCQVYALRALERELGFEKIYVIGTPCSDNTNTENFARTIMSSCATTMAARVPFPFFSCLCPICRLISSRSPAVPVSITPTHLQTSPSATWADRDSNGYWCAMNAARKFWNCSEMS
jgi:coenzyme F420 hydrogenase subunit beta